jgi:hypothetical protein
MTGIDWPHEAARGRPWTLLDYSLERYPFPDFVRNALRVGDLSALSADLPRRTWETDQQSPWHGLFYDGFPLWQHLYRRFVRTVIGPAVGEPFYYQAVPTFRVHLPGNVAVGEFHTDAQYNHPPGEETFWLPMTDAFGTCSIWIYDDNGERYAPYVHPGHMVRFSAVSRRHGNLVNVTGQSRVSFDFRALPVRLLPEDAEARPPTEHTKLRFVPGGYYVSEAIIP